MQPSFNLRIHFIYLLFAILIAGKSLAKSPQLQVVTELSPPYQTLVNNQVSGSATLLVKKALTASNLSASFHMYPWARAYNIAVTDPNTLIYAMAKTAERNDHFHWLLPVAHYKFGLVALSDNKDVNMMQLSQLSEFVVAVQRNDIAHQWALDFGLEEGKHLIVCSDIGCSWKLLLNKKVDFIVESSELIESMLAQHGLGKNHAKYVTAIPALELTGYLAANKNMDPSILKKLNIAIKSNTF